MAISLVLVSFRSGGGFHIDSVWPLRVRGAFYRRSDSSPDVLRYYGPRAARPLVHGESPMKETTQAKITASVAIAKAMAQKALSPNSNAQWTEYEMRSIDEWITRQGVKLDRPEAMGRLVELGLKAK